MKNDFFDYIIKTHSKGNFIAKYRRKQIFDILDDFLTRANIKSPFLIILGKSGIGKTALMVNYILQRQNNIVYYFINSNHRKTLSPQYFIQYLVKSLVQTSNIKEIILRRTINTQTEFLNEMIEKVSMDNLRSGKVHAIFIDGIDECINDVGIYDSSIRSIASVISSLKLPNNFRIVLSSSHDITDNPVLRLTLPSENIIKITGKDKENKKDIELFLKTNLRNYKIKNSEINQLVKNSQGNFQYASVVVDMINDSETYIQEIIKNTEEGLNDLYHLKLENIKAKNDNETWNNIVSACRVISFSISPLAPEIICDIIGIDRVNKHTIFSPIEQFLDKSIYTNINEGLCKWHHTSFQHVVENRKNIHPHKLGDICKRIILYIKKILSRGIYEKETFMLLQDFILYYMFYLGALQGIRNLPEYYFLNSDKFEKMLLFFKNVYFPTLLNKSDIVPPKFLETSIDGCCDISQFINYKLYIFFILLRRAILHVCDDLTLKPWFYLEKDATINWQMELENSGNMDFFSFVNNAIMKFQKKSISITELDMAIDSAFHLIKEEFKGLKMICVKCDQYSNKVIGYMNENKEQPKINKQLNDKPVKKKTLFKVYENWKEPKPIYKQTELQKYINKKSKCDIWVMEPNQYYFRENPVEPGRTSKKILKVILCSKTEKVIYYRDLYEAAGYINLNQKEMFHSNKLMNLQRRLSECNVIFGSVINSKEKQRRGEWVADENNPFFLIKTDFSFCYIEKVH